MKAEFDAADIAMGHTLQKEIIAECIETSEQLELLRAQGSDHIQGYYFSRPLPSDDFARFAHEQLAKSVAILKSDHDPVVVDL